MFPASSTCPELMPCGGGTPSRPSRRQPGHPPPGSFRRRDFFPLRPKAIPSEHPRRRPLRALVREARPAKLSHQASMVCRMPRKNAKTTLSGRALRPASRPSLHRRDRYAKGHRIVRSASDSVSSCFRMTAEDAGGTTRTRAGSGQEGR